MPISSSSVAISVKGLSKSYSIATNADKPTTLAEALVSRARRPFRSREMETFWALRDVNFEVAQGEVIGIIGRNGAGKSTLLKILSRITEPTHGEVSLYGRVGSLLEVGTGFHQELTGRENIYLSGAILGMTRADIRRRFDSIIDFAGIEKHLESPVKRYSSGMYVRLAFAVAAHLEPEIMVVDEVLAVGDAEFQKKCLRKMTEVSHQGRTILFVSHNMSAVRHICTRGFVFERGRLIEDGAIGHVVDNYLARTSDLQQLTERAETPSFFVDRVQMASTRGVVIKPFDDVEVRVQFTTKTDIMDPGLYVGILTQEGLRLAGLDFKDFSTIPALSAGESYEMGFDITALPLLPGSYQIELHLKDLANYKVELVPQTYQFEVVEAPVYGGRKLDSWFGFFGLRARAVAGGPVEAQSKVDAHPDMDAEEMVV